MPARKIRYNGPTPLIALPQIFLDQLNVEKGATMSVEMGENCIIVRPMGVATQPKSTEPLPTPSDSQALSHRPITKPEKAYIPSWVKDGEKLHEQERLPRDTAGSDSPASDTDTPDDRPGASNGTGELNSGSGDPGTVAGEQPE